LPDVTVVGWYGERGANHVEDKSAAIDRWQIERVSDFLRRNRERYGNAHGGLPRAKGAVRKKQDDDHERPRTHGSLACACAAVVTDGT
jgi:hypothetical protein